MYKWVLCDSINSSSAPGLALSLEGQKADLCDYQCSYNDADLFWFSWCGTPEPQHSQLDVQTCFPTVLPLPGQFVIYLIPQGQRVKLSLLFSRKIATISDNAKFTRNQLITSEERVFQWTPTPGSGTHSWFLPAILHTPHWVTGKGGSPVPVLSVLHMGTAGQWSAELQQPQDIHSHCVTGQKGSGSTVSEWQTQSWSCQARWTLLKVTALGQALGLGFPSDGDKFSHNTSLASKYQENQGCLG